MAIGVHARRRQVIAEGFDPRNARPGAFRFAIAEVPVAGIEDQLLRCGRGGHDERTTWRRHPRSRAHGNPHQGVHPKPRADVHHAATRGWCELTPRRGNVVVDHGRRLVGECVGAHFGNPVIRTRLVGACVVVQPVVDAVRITAYFFEHVHAWVAGVDG